MLAGQSSLNQFVECEIIHTHTHTHTRTQVADRPIYNGDKNFPNNGNSVICSIFLSSGFERERERERERMRAYKTCFAAVTSLSSDAEIVRPDSALQIQDNEWNSRFLPR